MMIGGLPIVVEHSAGERGTGGPVAALERVLASPLSRRYHFVRMHQAGLTSGVNTRLLRDWVGLLRRVKPDLVHVRGLQSEGLHGVLAARIAKCPRVIVTIHGTVRDLQISGQPWWRLALSHGAEPITLRAATHFATVCEYAAERGFLRPFSDKFLGVVPHGVPLPDDPRGDRDRIRVENGLRADDRVMIVVSHLSWHNGFATLAEALRRLEPLPDRCVLLVVGDGPDQPGIEAAFTAIPHVDVRFLGRRLDVADLLCAADLFVLPTVHETMSLALLEAMAHRLPVVAAAVGGNIEVLSRGGGLLVAPRDPQAWAGAIGQLLPDDRALHEMGYRGRRIIAQSYSLDVMLRALDSMYQRVLAASPA